jgi:hypothetical protein
MQWEYRVVYVTEYMEKVLNAYGGDGWELVGFSVRGMHDKLVFKRKKELT